MMVDLKTFKVEVSRISWRKIFFCLSINHICLLYLVLDIFITIEAWLPHCHFFFKICHRHLFCFKVSNFCYTSQLQLFQEWGWRHVAIGNLSCQHKHVVCSTPGVQRKHSDGVAATDPWLILDHMVETEALFRQQEVLGRLVFWPRTKKNIFGFFFCLKHWTS